MRYYLIAGEASGDLHGANLIKGIMAEDPDAEIRFWGGDLMAEASGGTAPVVHYRDGAVMGFAEVLLKAGTLSRRLASCKSDISVWHPDVVILIDYPGFNLRIAEFCHNSGIRVFYYIAPKTWASRSGRNKRLKEWVDKLFIIFPFEIPYFEAQGIAYEYHGNPLLDAVDNHEYKCPSEVPYIALLAGSRKSEVGHMMPVCMEAAGKLGMKVIIAGAPSLSMEDYSPYIPCGSNVEVIFGRTYDILKYAQAAIINSGTASLEAALIGTPQVVCWSSSKFTYIVAEYILNVRKRIKYISLGNLCLGRQAFRELVQDDFTPDAVCRELQRLIGDKEYRRGMLDDYEQIRKSLGGRGASAAIARAMIKELKTNAI
ncbi:MAG: lipid-A-disaccharide synthase [Bacteroidales bacterium]|nr:lipid-A-disaccharide synthase [Bacteroidales bacterium]